MVFVSLFLASYIFHFAYCTNYPVSLLMRNLPLTLSEHLSSRFFLKKVPTTVGCGVQRKHLNFQVCILFNTVLSAGFSISVYWKVAVHTEECTIYVYVPDFYFRHIVSNNTVYLPNLFLTTHVPCISGGDFCAP